jgi:hypothetical protein
MDPRTAQVTSNYSFLYYVSVALLLGCAGSRFPVLNLIYFILARVQGSVMPVLDPGTLVLA